jgi:hypothetical protein
LITVTAKRSPRTISKTARTGRSGWTVDGTPDRAQHQRRLSLSFEGERSEHRQRWTSCGSTSTTSGFLADLATTGGRRAGTSHRRKSTGGTGDHQWPKPPRYRNHRRNDGD